MYRLICLLEQHFGSGGLYKSRIIEPAAPERSRALEVEWAISDAVLTQHSVSTRSTCFLERLASLFPSSLKCGLMYMSA